MSNEQPGQGPGREPLQEPWRKRFDDLKSAYVLGALDESERREFEGYLAAHSEPQAEVDELDSVANLLTLSPQEQAPPPSYAAICWAVSRTPPSLPHNAAHAPTRGSSSQAGSRSPRSRRRSWSSLALSVERFAARRERGPAGLSWDPRDARAAGLGSGGDVRGAVVEVGAEGPF